MAHLHDDDEQRNDRFDVDADYEGGEWIGGEFFHRCACLAGWGVPAEVVLGL